MNREILQQALHHLVDLADDLRRIPSDIAQTIAALETELAKPESHIVKWSIPVDPNNFGEPLAQPEQWGDSAISDPVFLNAQRDINGAIRRLVQTEQEPVAWISDADYVEGQFVEGRPRRVWWECNTGVGQPLYTAPPRKPWQGLTDDELSKIYNDLYTQYLRDYVDIADFILIARAIQTKLKEKNGAA